MTMKRLVAAIAAAVTLTLTAGALPAAAVAPFTSGQLITSCGIGMGDASISTSGTIRGAASGCYADQSIKFFWYSYGIRTAKKSPYKGDVLATTYDGGQYTYVVYVDIHGALRLGRMSDAGTAIQSIVLSNAASYFSADIAAQNGKYWVVWSESIGGFEGQTELYQARTLAGTLGKTRITTTSQHDFDPSVAYVNGTLHMVWTRWTASGSTIRKASSSGGSWTSATFASAGTQNLNPSMVIVGGRTYVSWSRDGKIVLRDNSSGTYQSKVFKEPGWDSHVAVSKGKVFVAWGLEAPERVYLAEKSGSSWSGKEVTGAPAGTMALLALGGKAHLVYKTVDAVRVRYQT